MPSRPATADIVHGVVFTLSAREKNVLDRVEGSGYGVKDVRIKLEQGGIIEAYTYYATRIDPALKPLDWYLEHVLTGARENRLPESYIRLIESFEACEDQDRARRHVELSIYR